MQRRIGAAVVLAALALAGCSSGSDAPGTMSAADEPPPPPTSTVKIVSELPLEGLSAEETASMVNAIELYLDQIDHRVGDTAIEYESRDTSWWQKKAPWNDPGCVVAANELRKDEEIVGVVGPYGSDCAKVMLTGLRKQTLAVVSPSNSYDGLTREAPNNEKGEPAVYYPGGVRDYARLVPTDVGEGRAGAVAMAALDVTKVCVLDDGSAYGKTVADAFTEAAGELRLQLVCRLSWRPKPAGADYLGLMERVKASGADGIYLGGVSDDGGAALIRDKVTEVGDNEAVKLVVSDGFFVDELFDEAGPANVEGAYATSSTVRLDGLTGPGKVFAADYAERYGEPPTRFAPYAAAAVEVLVDAIGRSDGTRADVAAKLLETRFEEGILGPTSFDQNGDRVDAPVPLFQARDGAWVYVD